MRFTIAVTLAVLGFAAYAAAAEPYTKEVTPGTFNVDSVSFVPRFDRRWKDGTTVRVTMTGSTTKKITAGTLKYQLYELYVTDKEAEGNLPYFKCGNKGCDTSEGETLFLSDPDSATSDFSLEFDYTMGEAKKTGIFSLVFWGVDQYHTPYDFSVSIGYNYSHVLANAASTSLRGAAVPTQALTPAQAVVDAAPQVAANITSYPLKFKWNATNGNMTINSVSVTSSSDEWIAGNKANVNITGTIANKHILAGTLKFKIYELYVQYFIDSGFFPYFECSNKGCNPADPVSLHLADPTSVPTDFYITASITIPKSIANGKNPFNLLLFGVDQDHFPVDFSVSISYDLSA